MHDNMTIYIRYNTQSLIITRQQISWSIITTRKQP